MIEAGKTQVFTSHGDGWTNIGWTDGPIQIDHARVVGTDTPLPFEAFAHGLAAVSDVMLTVTATVADLAKLCRALHQVDLLMNPRKHGHCPTCHPEQDRRPLTVNGHEYHRRQRARQRRRRHGH